MMRISFFLLFVLAMSACSSAPEIRQPLTKDFLSLREEAPSPARRTLPDGPLTLTLAIQEARAHAPALAAAILDSAIALGVTGTAGFF